MNSRKTPEGILQKSSWWNSCRIPGRILEVTPGVIPEAIPKGTFTKTLNILDLLPNPQEHRGVLVGDQKFSECLWGSKGMGGEFQRGLLRFL